MIGQQYRDGFGDGYLHARAECSAEIRRLQRALDQAHLDIAKLQSQLEEVSNARVPAADA